MISVAQRLRSAAEALVCVTETPRLDAELLMSHAMGVSRTHLLARFHEEAPGEPFDALLARRQAYEPIAYIVGEWEFFSLSFIIRPPMLVPRPETEHLVEAVLDAITPEPARILELGTGSGCVAVSIAVNSPETELIATDIAPNALELARENTVQHHLSERITFYQGDLFHALPADTETFDIICSNPPYVEEDAWDTLSSVIRNYEDPGALLAGPEGLAIIERLVGEGRRWLRPGGLLAFEIGMGQYRAIETLLHDAGYQSIRFIDDLAGIPRVASARTA